jgi:hypothetical protein
MVIVWMKASEQINFKILSHFKISSRTRGVKRLFKKRDFSFPSFENTHTQFEGMNTPETNPETNSEINPSNMQVTALNNFKDWLNEVPFRDNEVPYTDTIPDNELGTLYWRVPDGRTIGCPLNGMQFLIDNDFNECIQHLLEEEYGPISEFPERLEELAEKFLEGARLAREANIHKRA